LRRLTGLQPRAAGLARAWKVVNSGLAHGAPSAELLPHVVETLGYSVEQYKMGSLRYDLSQDRPWQITSLWHNYGG
jgi:hypothetical protein